MLSLNPFLEDQGRLAVPIEGIPPVSFLAPYKFTHSLTHTLVKLLCLCFKMGLESQEARAWSTQVFGHVRMTHVAFHNHGEGVSVTMLTARARAATAICVGPCSKLIDGLALVIPHLIGTHH